jgi:hypothetical protein
MMMACLPLVVAVFTRVFVEFFFAAGRAKIHLLSTYV